MVIDAVYWFGIRGYEGTVSRTWERLCRQSSSVLEVGGNIGLFSVIGGKSSVFDSYLVVEPVPQNVKTLRLNLARNNISSFEILEAAAIPGFAPAAVKLNVPSEGRSQPVGAHLTNESEVSGRTTDEILTVNGIPMLSLIEGRDLVKIDAEGIEYALLSSVKDYIVENSPSLVIEVLPESVNLGLALRDLCKRIPYNMYALPEYGRDDIVLLDPSSFSSITPGMCNAKDVVLTRLKLH